MYLQVVFNRTMGKVLVFWLSVCDYHLLSVKLWYVELEFDKLDNRVLLLYIVIVYVVNEINTNGW